MSTVYLLHFERPIGNLRNPRGQAQHYLGWTSRALHARLKEHQQGNHAKIMTFLHLKGIRFALARTWQDGTLRLEKQLKRRHDARQLCPICRGEKEYTAYEPKK